MYLNTVRVFLLVSFFKHYLPGSSLARRALQGNFKWKLRLECFPILELGFQFCSSSCFQGSILEAHFLRTLKRPKGLKQSLLLQGAGATGVKWDHIPERVPKGPAWLHTLSRLVVMSTCL